MYWIFRTLFLSSLLSTFKNADGKFDMFFKTNVLSKIYAGVVETNIDNDNNIWTDKRRQKICCDAWEYFYVQITYE